QRAGPLLGAAGGIPHLGGGGPRCARVGVLEGVARVDTGAAVVVGQHEVIGQGVGVAVLVVQRLAVALGVVVVDEHAGILGIELALGDRVQPGDRSAEGGLQLPTVV